MKILHTSDWHVGKLLRGRSRIDEHRAVLGEIAEIAAREKVDLVLVVGDLFETAAPPPEATAVVFDALLALRETGAHLVVVGGNHDQQSELDTVAPVFARLGISVLGLPAGPDRAVVRLDGASVVMLPWMSQRWAVKTEQLMGTTAAGVAQYYAARVARLVEWLCAGFSPADINIVAAHCMVQGGKLGGGERDAQLIDDYMIPAGAFPSSASYVALGHLHRTQLMPGPAPIWYSGSPIQVDFGESDDRKQVLLIDAPATGSARVTPVELTRGWRLRTVRGTLAELAASVDDDAFLRVVVHEQPRPGLADEVRALLPQAVDVRVASEHSAASAGAEHQPISAGLRLSPRDLFAAYLDYSGQARDPRVLALFDELLDVDTDDLSGGERLMRPVELVMQGFGPFHERVTVDFADAELIAIVGATGHGKSSIIDAICFALYGRVPRHGDKDIAPVITLGAAEAQVALTFTLGERRYIATRLVRRNADGVGAKTRALRLEEVLDDGTTEILAGSVHEFDPRLRALLGLDFDQFTKCVVLPQGRFAAFLQASSGERSAILGALLGLGRYDRMGKAARDRAGHARGLREALEQERNRAQGLDAEVLAAHRGRRDALAGLIGDIEAAREAGERLAAEIEECRREGDMARSVVTALGPVRVDHKIAPLAHAIAEATEARAVVVADAEAAEARVTAAANALDELPPLEQLTSALEAHADRATIAARIANGTEVHTGLVVRASEARDALVAAQQAVADAQSAVDEANRRHTHAELRASLVRGEPCPVCEQTVTALPPKLSTAAAARARKALDAAGRADRSAETNANTVLAELHRAEAQLETLRERQDELGAKIEANPDRAVLEATIAGVQARREEAQTARTEAGLHKEAVAAANRRVAAAEQKLVAGEQAFQRQRDAVVAVGLAPPAVIEPNLLARWETLAQFAEDQGAEAEKRAVLAEEQHATLTAERAAQLGELRVRATAAGLDARPTTLPDFATAVTGAHRDAVHVVEQAEQQLARVAELDRDIAAARDDEQVAQLLGRLLDRGHFRQWIVDEALRGLVDGASDVLRRLSSGQYSLAVTNDSDLLVVDHVNADETRSVNSLSGGETFQASLALALALADRISELAGDGTEPLESIFLDEGFGALDPETLDVVAGTIEALARHDRIVGVVTHVRELAERMPVRFRVRKESGTSVVTREES